MAERRWFVVCARDRRLQRGRPNGQPFLQPPQGDPDAAEAAFAQLEIVTRTQGYHGASDRAYVQGQRWQQRRLWQEGCRWCRLEATWKWFEDGYARYGRVPWRALCFEIFLILGFGVFLGVMQAQRRFPSQLNPFEYSVTCLLPDKWHKKRGSPQSALHAG